MKRVKETVLRRQGRKKLLRRDYIAYGHKIAEEFVVEEPGGRRGMVSQTHFKALPEAERSLGAGGEADWWTLAPKGDRPPAKDWWALR